LARKRSLPAPLARWHEVRDRIYREIHDTYWRPDLGAFVGYKGGEALDAATLLMPLVRFIGPTDRRWTSTLRLIEDRLVEDSLVYRLREAEEAKETEGTFSACSFWYVENVSRTGDLQKARLYFEKMLGYGNHLGLFSEELGARGEHLGNFPQALTHLALISAAYDLDRRLSDPLDRRRTPVAFDVEAGEGGKDGSR
jgi:GH15 family glucan-1,4-alpha-glucosidase